MSHFPFQSLSEKLVADCLIGYFLVQSIIVYTLGIKTVTNMIGDDISGYERATGVAFIVTLLVTLLAAEAMHWLVEVPSIWFGRWLFDWIRK